MNEDDPRAKAQIVKFKQEKMFELTDQRKLVNQLAITLVALRLAESHSGEREVSGVEVEKAGLRSGVAVDDEANFNDEVRHKENDFEGTLGMSLYLQS